jgi:hypothetical protein
MRLGKGRVFIGEVEAALTAVGVSREPMFDHPGLCCVRRAVDGGHDYFIANRSEQQLVRDWVPLGRGAKSAVVMDPLSGQMGVGAVRERGGRVELSLKLEPGQSVIVQFRSGAATPDAKWQWWEARGESVTLTGSWHVSFMDGGPELPAAFQTQRLASWTELGGTNAQCFAGTAHYSLAFDVPAAGEEQWELDLGQVCQSARVRLNGQSLGTLINPPFRVTTGRLKGKDNQLEVEVTNVSANRIRDLDRRGVKWKNFYDINFVNLDYKPFDASNWPLTPSGLLGPVRLTPVAAVKAEQ